MERNRRVSTTPRRSYDNSRRRADAENRQRRIVDAATRLFVDQGFGGTSIEQIAAVADVSPQTVYAAYGSKAAVLSKAIDVALVGDFESPPLADRLPVLADTSSGKHRLYFAAAAHFVRELHERVAPLMRVMEQASATDTGLEELRRRLQREIRADTTIWIAQLRPALREGLTEARAADVMVTVQSPYVYSTLTVDLGWSADQYERWLADAMPRLLLRSEFAPADN
jgi:AcrR family transcriptional regulator